MKSKHEPEVRNTEIIIRSGQLNDNAGQVCETVNQKSADIAHQEGCGICGNACGSGC